MQERYWDVPFLHGKDWFFYQHLRLPFLQLEKKIELRKTTFLKAEGQLPIVSFKGMQRNGYTDETRIVEGLLEDSARFLGGAYFLSQHQHTALPGMGRCVERLQVGEILKH